MANRILITVAGRPAEVTHVHLYPSPMVQEWRGLVAKASVQMGGVSSPIGFLGSPEWVIGGAVVSGLLTSAVSGAMAKDGAKTITDAASKLQSVRESGIKVPVADMAGIEAPYPSSWSALGPWSKRLDYSKEAMLQRGAFLAKHGKTKADVQDGFITVTETVPYVILDPEFVLVHTDRQFLHVRWSAVDSYSLV